MRALILDNLSWKLLSLTLAILIWYGTRQFMRDDIRPIAQPLQPLATRDFQDLPIRILSPGLAVGAVRVEPPSVLVRIGGELSMLERLTEKDPLVFIELPANLADGPFTNRIDVRLPPGLRLLSVVPERVIVRQPSPP